MARYTRATPSNAFASVLKIIVSQAETSLLSLPLLSSRDMANENKSSRQVFNLHDGSLLARAPVSPVSLVLGPAEANVLCNRSSTYTLASASEVHGTF
jgi:hypothetical protein